MCSCESRKYARKVYLDDVSSEIYKMIKVRGSIYTSISEPQQEMRLATQFVLSVSQHIQNPTKYMKRP